MTPFQHFRLWARRAPLTERLAALVAALVVVGALAWVVAPEVEQRGATAAATSGIYKESSAASAGRTGSVAVTATGPAAPNGMGAAKTSSVTVGGVVAGNRVAPALPSARDGTVGGATQGCVAAQGGTQGVTAGQIKIAVTLVNIGGVSANSSVGVPPTSQQQADYQAVIDAINAQGGVACRRLVPEFFTVDPADGADQQSKCLDVVSAKPFAELDFNGYSSVGASCFAQHHLPFFGAFLMSNRKLQQGYPYVFDMGSYNSLYHHTVFGLHRRGFFSASNGFAKLGWIYRDCDSDVISDEKNWLAQIGISGSKLVPYDAGCPEGGGGLVTPDVMEQAVLTFQRAGVTHVTTSEFTADFQSFTNVAQQQNFHPKYGLGDDSIIPVTYGNLHPNFQNMAGAIAITEGRNGEEHTPGMRPSPATAKCDAIVKAKGQPSAYQQQVGASGLICDQLWMFAAAAQHAPTLSPTALAAGLQKTASVDFSYPEGPNDFSGSQVTTGGQDWRTAAFLTSCNCWHVIETTFHRGFG